MPTDALVSCRSFDTLGEEISDVSEAEAKAMVEPDGVTDNRRRKRVAVVAQYGGRQSPNLAAASHGGNAVRRACEIRVFHSMRAHN